MEWLKSLTPEQTQMVVGLLVMVVFAIIKAVLAWTGRPLPATTAAKLQKFLAVAAGAALATLAVTGLTPAFWQAWIFSTFTAVGSWEGLSKLWGWADTDIAEGKEG